MSDEYAGDKDFILEQTYYQQGDCCFVGDMWIVGTAGLSRYDNDGNLIQRWGR